MRLDASGISYTDSKRLDPEIAMNLHRRVDDDPRDVVDLHPQFLRALEDSSAPSASISFLEVVLMRQSGHAN